jgi:hypothetical protein
VVPVPKEEKWNKNNARVTKKDDKKKEKEMKNAKLSSKIQGGGGNTYMLLLGSIFRSIFPEIYNSSYFFVSNGV